jgi:hypothetical protein
MLKQMAQACLADILMPRAHPVPYLKGRGRRLMVLKNEDLQAVLQVIFRNIQRKGMCIKQQKK